jgi:hypothetical protein
VLGTRALGVGTAAAVDTEVEGGMAQVGEVDTVRLPAHSCVLNAR